MSERAVRRLDRILREGPPDLVEAVRAGAVSLKEADRRRAEWKASQVPTGPVHARERGGVDMDHTATRVRSPSGDRTIGANPSVW